jgi:hypothetical protein
MYDNKGAAVAEYGIGTSHSHCFCYRIFEKPDGVVEGNNGAVLALVLPVEVHR